MLGFSFSFDYFPRFSRISPSSVEVSREISTRVYMLYELEQVLEWSVPTHFGTCSFDIYKSETEYGPWEKINISPTSDNYYRVNKSVKDSKFLSDFFIIECTKEDSTKVKSNVFSVQNVPIPWVGLRAREIQRREWWLLSKFSGVQSLLFRKKTFGKRCPNCWDPVAEKIVKERCPVCFGTSFEGGYFTGYPTYIQYEPTPNNAILSYQGKLEPNSIQSWTIGFPEATTFDLVLRIPDWKMYRVDAMQTTELQAVPIKQSFLLTELSKNDIEYKLAEQAVPEEYKI